ncbi:MAG: hypothetical protein KKB31_07665 [Nanoarchaeota archaeon]|nr:hypothetical protein [Nanoarchaeota archaeon]
MAKEIESLGIYLRRYRCKNDIPNTEEDQAITFIADENGSWVPWEEVEKLLEEIKKKLFNG